MQKIFWNAPKTLALMNELIKVTAQQNPHRKILFLYRLLHNIECSSPPLIYFICSSVWGVRDDSQWCSTENSAQYPVTIHGKHPRENGRGSCTAGSLCCTADVITALQINSTSLKLKKKKKVVCTCGSQCLISPAFPFGNHLLVFYLCASTCFVSKFICITFVFFLRFHI